MIDILYKSENAVVIYKPHGIPTQKDPTGTTDAMSLTGAMLATMGENEKLWLIHRLDRAVSGLLVFARNKEVAAHLCALVRDRYITKQYLAVIEGEGREGVLEDLLYKDARNNKAYVVDRKRVGVKEAVLSYRTLSVVETERGKRSLVYITLETGRFHQIRAQFSSRKMPLCGDKKYGSRDGHCKNIALCAIHLSLDMKEEQIDITKLPDIKAYPWSLFSKEIYEGRNDEN